MRRGGDEGSLGFSPVSFAGFESVAAEGEMARNGSFSSFSRAKPTPLLVNLLASINFSHFFLLL